LALAIPRALITDAKVIVAMTDPPLVGIAVALVARLRRRPFVYSIQDLHPDMALASGLVRPSPLIRLWEKAHRWSIRQANRVTVLGEDMRERIVEKGLTPERVFVVRSGAPIPGKIAAGDHLLSQEIRCGFPFAVVHAGNLGFYGAWETLIEAARLLNREEVGFIFVGDGAAKSLIEASASSCHRVRFIPFRPLEEIQFVLAAADVHIVTVRRGLEGLVVPSKLYSILAAGRPVLAVVPENSDVARIVTRSGCGLVADPDNVYSVVAAVRSLFLNRVGLERMAERARAVAIKYDRRMQMQRFVQLVEEVSMSQRRSGQAFG